MLTFLRRWPYFDWMKIIFSVIEIQVEALYFYAPFINDVRKCFDMHQQFLENAFMLGFVLIGIHVVIFLSYKNPLGFVINFLMYYSILAMAGLITLEKQGYPIFFDPMKYFKILLCIRYLARIISINSLFSTAVRSSTELAEAKWIKLAVNLYLYVQAANVFGGLWYFMAIERATECWMKACIAHAGQSCRFSCRVNLEEDQTYIDEFCPSKIRNTTLHDFGIFHGALESGIVEGTSILQKFLYCFVWGLQNLSNLGQDLQSGSDVWENIFVILVVGSGFLLFALLIGNMKIYLQSRTVRLKEMTVKPREIEEWKPFQNLSPNLQQEMKKYKPYIRRKTNHIDIENLLNNIPKELGKKIKRELCWHLLKKVHEFRMLKEETLDALCDSVKPTLFAEHSHIIREGDPIDELVFVLQGNLWTYSFNDITNGFTRNGDHLEDSDFYGAELVDWALRDCSSFEFSKSTKTIEAVTNVEAFTLMAEELKIVFNDTKSIKTIEAVTNVEAFTLMADELKIVFNDKRNQAASFIQLAWRHYTRRKSRFTKRRPMPLPVPLKDKVKEKTPVPQRSKVNEKTLLPQRSKVNEKTLLPQRGKVKEKMIVPRRGRVKSMIWKALWKRFQERTQSWEKKCRQSWEKKFRYRKGLITRECQRDPYSASEIDESSGSSISGKFQRDPYSAPEIYEPGGPSISERFQRGPYSAHEIYELSGPSISGNFQRDPSSALEIDEPSGSSISGKFQRDPSPALEIYEPSGSSISGKFQRDPSPALEIDEPSGCSELSTSNVKRLLYEMKNILLRWPYFDWMQIILVVIVTSVDPLFFYLPVINNLRMCLDLQDHLSDIANMLSTVLLVIHVFIIVCIPFASYLMHIGENSHKNQWCFIIFDFLIFLPITQMARTLLIETMGGPKFVDSVRSFKHVVFIQYVARIIRIYALFSKAIRGLSKHATATWARFAFNFFLYLQAANEFGGLWYFMAIERETECWTKACINYTRQSHCSFNCHDNLEDYTFLNEFCPMKTRNERNHDVGIFHGALESGILEGKNFLQKVLHCFVWGLRNLSNLGHNLQTTGNVEENIFVILVVSSGFVLFALLIGNMQKCLKLGVKEMTLEPREIEEWQPFQKLSKNLQQNVKKYKSYIRRKTDYIDVVNLLNNLPNELRREVKRELCWNLLKKVQEFRKLNEVTLDALCDCVRPTSFNKQTHFLREGDPINEMIFVVQGKLCTYTFKDIQSGSTSSDHKRYDGKNTRKEDLQQDGDFHGEELIDWALRDCFSFDMPKSNRTIQALTNVEAFTLMADDLKNCIQGHDKSVRSL